MGSAHRNRDTRSGIWQCDEMVFGLTGGMAACPRSRSYHETELAQPSQRLPHLRLTVIRASERASDLAASLAGKLRRWAEHEREKLAAAKSRAEPA